MSDTTLHLRTILVAGKDPKRSEEIAGILTEELAGVIAVPEALKDMEADAVKSTGQRNFPKAKDNGILYLTDSPAFHERARKEGQACACFTDDPGSSGDFPGAMYLLTEPEWVDLDSYEKIYERLSGLPWTITVTERLIIRELSMEDFSDLMALYDDPEAKRFLAGPLQDKALEKENLSRYIRQVYGLYGYGYWAVEERKSHSLVGLAGFQGKLTDRGEAELGFLVRKDKRRQGIATEICRGILAFARKALPFTGVIATCDPDNKGSAAVLTALGFRQEERAIKKTDNGVEEQPPVLYYVLDEFHPQMV